LVAGVEHMQEVGVRRAARLDDDAARHQRGHLGYDGEHEVRPPSCVACSLINEVIRPCTGTPGLGCTVGGIGRWRVRGAGVAVAAGSSGAVAILEGGVAGVGPRWGAALDVASELTVGAVSEPPES
jgi:hypothetical protein